MPLTQQVVRLWDQQRHVKIARFCVTLQERDKVVMVTVDGRQDVQDSRKEPMARSSSSTLLPCFGGGFPY